MNIFKEAAIIKLQKIALWNEMRFLRLPCVSGCADMMTTSPIISFNL